MTEAEAIKEMTKLWGKKAAWRYNKKALNAEQKEELKSQLQKLNAAKGAAEKARDDKRAELLKDPEYLRLADAAKQAHTDREKVAGNLYSSRVTIGEIDHGFFCVKAEGDNWGEAIRKAKAKE